MNIDLLSISGYTQPPTKWTHMYTGSLFCQKNYIFLEDGFPKAQKGGFSNEYPQVSAKTLSCMNGSLLGKLQRRLKFK
jgi:hypothetical protein